MPDQPQGAKPSKELKVAASPEIARGVFSNLVLIRHTREEFIFDFIFNVPGHTQLQSRVVLTPDHAKRLLGALQENIARHESGGDFSPVNTQPA